MTRRDETTTPTPRRTSDGRLPGDLSPQAAVERMIRVDHAGEYGAARIYDGQLAILGATRSAPAIRHMAAQEKRHLEAFDRLVVQRRVRPTILSPVWHVAGYALGAASALVGARAAMACTAAVESVIDEHYARQIDALGDDEADLRETIAAFREDEIAHRDTALANEAEQAPAYGPVSAAIKAGTRMAIWLSERF